MSATALILLELMTFSRPTEAQHFALEQTQQQHIADMLHIVHITYIDRSVRGISSKLIATEVAAYKSMN